MGLFSHDSSSSNHTCPDKSLANPPQEPLVGSFSFHQVAVILSGAFGAFACLLCFYLIFRHATHFAIPKEQKQIIRIIFIIPVFAVMSFLSVAFNDASIYLEPLETLYESFALSSFFLLLLAFIQEDDVERQAFFETSGTVAAYRKTALCVFQFPVVQFILFVVTEITEATGSYCATSDKLYFAHIWITVITALTTGVAIMSVFRFYKTMKMRVGHRKPMDKLIAFKGIVFLQFLQNFIFSLLTSSSDLHPSSKMTYKDLTVAIPNLIVSIEMAIFACAFLYVYRAREYCFKKGAAAVPLGHGGYSGGFLGLGAIVQALNIADLVSSIIGCISGRLSGGGAPTKAYGTGQQEC